MIKSSHKKIFSLCVAILFCCIAPQQTLAKSDYIFRVFSLNNIDNAAQYERFLNRKIATGLIYDHQVMGEIAVFRLNAMPRSDKDRIEVSKKISLMSTCMREKNFEKKDIVKIFDTQNNDTIAIRHQKNMNGEVEFIKSVELINAFRISNKKIVAKVSITLENNERKYDDFIFGSVGGSWLVTDN